MVMAQGNEHPTYAGKWFLEILELIRILSILDLISPDARVN